MTRSIRKLIICSVTLGLSIVSNSTVDGQQISKVDFDKIKTATTDSTSSFYYKYLLEKIANFDGYISPEEYHYLYYGNTFQDSYAPYKVHDLEEEFEGFLQEGEYRKAIGLAKEILAENPVNLAYTYHMLACYHELAVDDTARIYAERYYSFLDAIARSGDGRSPETAFVVIKVNDEYQLLFDMRCESLGTSLTYSEWGPADRHKLKKSKGEKGSGEIEEIFFNVAKPFEHMKASMQIGED